MEQKLKVAVMGARGYSGLELSQLLLKHPKVDYLYTFSTQSDFKLSHYIQSPSASSVENLKLGELERMALELDVIFLATPADVSMQWAPKILEASCSVIDLSGAYRIEKKLFEDYYGFKHLNPDLIERAHYGLIPWNSTPSYTKNTKEQVGPFLIANPGCYASAALLALIPLLKNQIIQEQGIVIDAKSGVSGAGKKAHESLLFSEVFADYRPYKVGKHQHYPEIISWVKSLTGSELSFPFTTSLIPIERGIVVSLYAQLSKKWDGFSDEQKGETFTTLLKESFASYPLVKIINLNDHDYPPHKVLSLKQVTHTPGVKICFHIKDKQLMLFSFIDNLQKGAASSAIENMNHAFELGEIHLGLGEF